MDPTQLLLSLTETSTSISLPESFTSDPEVPSFKENTILADKIEVKRLKPIYLVDLAKFQLYQELKEKLERDYNNTQLDTARSRINPFEEIGRSIFFNRSAVKLANLDALYQLTKHLGFNLSFTTPGHFRYACLADAPGGFIEYLQWRRPDSVGYTVSINEIPYRKDRLDLSRLKILEADIRLKYKSISQEILKQEPAGLELVTGDIGMSSIKGTSKEIQYLPLLLAQTAIALRLVMAGGDVVLNFVDTVTEVSAQLIYLISLCFEEIHLIKPISSRPTSDERYLIGKRKKADITWVIHLLETALDKYHLDEWIVNLIDERIINIDADFTGWLSEKNQYFIERLLEYNLLRRKFLQEEDISLPKYNLNRAYSCWYIPGNLIQPKSLWNELSNENAIPFSSGHSYIS